MTNTKDEMSEFFKCQNCMAYSSVAEILLPPVLDFLTYGTKKLGIYYFF